MIPSYEPIATTSTPPEDVNGFAADTTDGDVESAFVAADVTIDQTYTTPLEHNNPMEPHACIAIWEDDAKGGRACVTLYDSTQGVHVVRETLAPMFGLELEQMRVVAPHVGGGFGSKGSPHAHNVLAILAARRTAGRPVKFALTRQQMFAIVGYRTSTIQHLRLGANTHGLLTAMSHDVIEQTSKIKEYAEQTAVATRIMYATPNRSTSHRVAALDVAVPFWMRAPPGETPGMYAVEVAMDELAVACGLDPIELRVRNEPEVDPESGKPWSGRNLIDCMYAGAERFGWKDRSRRDGRRPVRGGLSPDGNWMVGTGMAAATYPAMTNPPGSKARIVFGADRIYTVQIGAADIGTGTWTALTQIAADALECHIEEVRLQIGDTTFPFATVAGGSAGISSWGLYYRRGCPSVPRGTQRHSPLLAWRRQLRRRRIRTRTFTPCIHSVLISWKRAYIARPARSGSPPDARCILDRTCNQCKNASLTAHWRNDDGIVDGFARGKLPGQQVRPRDDSRLGELPHQHKRGCARHRGLLARRD